jgi:Tol biopolymer transport system component
MNYTLSERKPVILYADHPDFQQTNVVSGQLTEGTGGVTESLLDRIVMPLTGYYSESDHVLGHEAVHVFQYDIANKDSKSVQFARSPLWMVEGMAEYLSVGPKDAHTAMWLRDALLRDDLPTIDDLTTSGRYFPYRYGEALWAYVAGNWGDEMVTKLFRESLQDGFGPAALRLIALRTDSLSRRWHEAIRAAYTPRIEGRTAPRATGKTLIAARQGRPEYYVGPALSPDGRLLAYFHSGIQGVELKLADASTGEELATLAAPGLSTRFDALSFLYSAGSWSPDAKQLAFISYNNGDNEIDIVDIDSRDIVRRIRPEGIGAISTVAWSPDGRTLAFSGMVGGLSDLYLHDLSSGTTRRLTNDRYADMQPSWSPDGSRLVFASDRGVSMPESAESGTDFERLSHAPLRLATIDVASGRVEVIAGFRDAKHVSPQFTPDGQAILFVSDHDGYSDLYRLDVGSGVISQVTRTVTGVSGISSASPAFSVARQSGLAVISLFEEGGIMLASLTPEETRGTTLAAPGTSIASAAVLPGGRMDNRVATYVDDYTTGLPAESTMEVASYSPGLRLAYVGLPSLGATVGGPFGTIVQGQASAAFTDILGNHFLGVSATAAGTLRDLGGQLLYINSARRWTWGVNAQRAPYLYGYGVLNQNSIDYVLAHIAVSSASFLTQYAQSQSNRFEFSAGVQHYDYYVESTTLAGQDADNSAIPLDAPPSLALGIAEAAYVGDDAFMGFTSPIAGTRYRFAVSPTIGTLSYQSYLADYRRYLRFGRLTLAARGLGYGRFGRDSDSDRIGAVFLGDPSLVRGYGYDSFDITECVPSSGPDGSLDASTCPQFDRLLGSRIAVANVELRIPLFGQRGMGLIETIFPPLEISPFVDAGVAWTGSSDPVWSFASNTSDRTPVVSVGVTSRLNLFGFAVLEIFHARPFQRPGRGGVWGFNLLPGW